MNDQPRQLAHSTVSIGTGDTLALAANLNRSYLLLINDGANDIYIEFGAGPAVVGDGIRLNNGGGSLEISARNGNLDTRQIRGITTVAATDLLVTEA